MKYAFFQGCNIPVRIQQYALATEAVLNKFGVELQVMRDFNCCGYPMRNVDEKSYILPSVRNLAVAEKAGLDIMVICNCCFQSLKKAASIMAKNPELAAELNGMLAKEGLRYTGATTIKHYLTVLHTDIGIAAIKEKLVYRFKGLNSAVIHGCHLLRPREIMGFDDSFVPKITEDLMAVAGATSLDWLGRLECCGAALAGFNDELSIRLLNEKISGAKAAGAQYITPICSYCHLQFDTAQVNSLKDESAAEPFPVLLYPQLLGLCLGIDAASLGLAQNQTITSQHISNLTALLGPPVEEKKSRKKAKATS
ncbi:CoB--CoM heterodisulfide reductase iron-sulfur subunit B family protein [Desulfopila aestuarii]|uniref:Heterodisulfide reductase subunit B n=1 Tax=Desulfopila aestuarii DSM 18488 TaxID=1121416 RepID=A0A1M7YAA1_9BACT|nr:CoB--CoM heterodisulfide reductase iron-sulfur subunit B family protein [Desulfopila aestuarii]SHO49537.1 heterodisulfide reductase subunit B [Desulfopila aestuarii DSM 18488]